MPDRLISADALKKLIANHVYPVADAFNNRDNGMFWTGGIEKAIDEVPTVDVESLIAKHEDIGYEKGYRDGYAEALTDNAEPVKHGHWVVERDEMVMHCASCAWVFEYYGGLEEVYNFCPHCGAKMDEVEDGNNN